ncbi:hypothetical protein CEXT_71051 [Caerostris extrusa]|uniref:Uncharacterized protein n=1 Tax=Caerostris extrusa TaxID=172846 RepID=A0AAV4MWE4_CAEEX|nr:hypothetical protein CEXT_71051 [Caerostris extrusa]
MVLQLNVQCMGLERLGSECTGCPNRWSTVQKQTMNPPFVNYSVNSVVKPRGEDANHIETVRMAKSFMQDVEQE